MKRLFFSLMLLGLGSSLGAQPAPFRVEHTVASNNPQLTTDGIYQLNIPFVDTAVPGLYQDVRIEYAPQTRSWRMAAYNTGILLPPHNIHKVELVLTEQLPLQAFLRVTGSYPSGCHPPGTSQRITGTTFQVSLFSQHVDSFPPGPLRACLAVEVPFVRTIPLNIYGLTAGTYRYELNDWFNGSFTLTADNVLE